MSFTTSQRRPLESRTLPRMYASATRPRKFPIVLGSAASPSLKPSACGPGERKVSPGRTGTGSLAVSARARGAWMAPATSAATSRSRRTALDCGIDLSLAGRGLSRPRPAAAINCRALGTQALGRGLRAPSRGAKSLSVGGGDARPTRGCARASAACGRGDAREALFARHAIVVLVPVMLVVNVHVIVLQALVGVCVPVPFAEEQGHSERHR